MTSQKILSRQLRLRPHAFLPSEDDPREFILIATDSGAALGISHAEKRLLEFIDGKRSLAEIIDRVIYQRIASLSTLRRLIWDLDRYGFLENNPWEIEGAVEGWGYWGKFDAGLSSFWISPVLGAYERIIGRILISPLFHFAAVLMLAAGIWRQWDLFQTVEPFLIRNSVALGCLVVFVSALGGALLAFWMGAMMLRAVYPSPVRCVADYRCALPIFLLDGRRLRALPARKSLRCAASPIVGLLFLSSLFVFGAGVSEGARMEGMLHTGAAFWFVSFLYLIPWNSTLISRDVMARVREESVFGLLIRAVRKLFHYLFQRRRESEPHDRLCLIWGAWALLSGLLLVHLSTFLLRWEFPFLVNLFLIEENRAILFAFILLAGVFTSAVLSVVFSFFFWLGAEIVREVRNRYWPERDVAVLFIALAAAVFGAAQYFWILQGQWFFFHAVPLAFCGVFLIGMAVRSWRMDGRGFEPLVHWFPILSGVFALALSFGGANPAADQIPSELAGFYSGDVSIGLVWKAGCTALLSAAWMVYWIALAQFLFITAKPLSHRWKIKTAASAAALGISVGVNLWIPVPLGAIECAGRILITAAFLTACACSIWVGWFLNYSTAFLCGGSILIFVGAFLPDRSAILGSGSFTICMGALFSAAGLILRHSGKSKQIALYFQEPHAQTANGPWLWNRLARECETALRELYGATVKIAPSGEMTEEAMRNYFTRLRQALGVNSLHALMRRIACAAPWEVTRRLINVLPASISVPHLTDWTPERVEQALRKIPTFADLGRYELSELAARARVVLYKPGDRPIHQGKREGCIFTIVQGSLSVEFERPFGNQVMAVFGEGDYVGEIGFLAGLERTADVRALSPCLLLCVHREDVDYRLPDMYAAMQAAESGNSWINAFCQSAVFRDFPPSLSARIYVESRHIQLERGESLWLENRDFAENVAVFLLGKGSMMNAGESSPLAEGTLLGLEASLTDQPMQGTIRAETASHIIVVNRVLFRDALAELFTPPCVLNAGGEPPEES